MKLSLEEYAEKLAGEHNEFVIFMDYKEKKVDTETYEFNLFSFDFNDLPIYSIVVEDYEEELKRLNIDILPGFLFFDKDSNLNIIDILEYEANNPF